MISDSEPSPPKKLKSWLHGKAHKEEDRKAMETGSLRRQLAASHVEVGIVWECGMEVGDGNVLF